MLIAGEASGDLHASNLISSLQKLDPKAEFRFFGGDLMAKAARVLPEIHYENMNVMGFSEVIRKLPRIMRNLSAAKRLVRDFRPDVLILVDYPSFNLKVAKYAHGLGVKVDYFISPKVWAWKEFRVKQIKKYVDNLYSILPFEVPFFQKHDYKVTYVGNPSVQEIDYALGHLPPRKHFVERQGLNNPEKPIIALLPGSRRGEIRNNLPLMIEAARRFPDYDYVVAAAPAVPEKFYREVAQDPGLQLVFGSTPTLLKYSRAAIVTSGTATLETALIGTPQVVCYRGNGSKFTYKLMEKVLKVKFVSLPNLIVGNSVVPELLLYQCTPAAIARELSPLLQNSPKREWQISGYKNMRRRLGNSVASDYVAELITDSLGLSHQESGDDEGNARDVTATSGVKEDTSAQRRPRRRKKRKVNTDVTALLMALFLLLPSCKKESAQQIDVYESLREVNRLELSKMTVGKVGTVSDPEWRDTKDWEGKARFFWNSMKVGKRIGVYSYDTYVVAYIDLSKLNPDDITVDRETGTVDILLPQVEVMIDGREPQLHEEHYRVTGFRSRITPEERARLKAQMAKEVKKELASSREGIEALKKSAQAKARVWITELVGNWDLTANVNFR